MLPDFSNWQNPEAVAWLLNVYGKALVHEGTFYLTAVLGVWLLLHVLLRKRLGHRLIAKWPAQQDIRREMRYSVTTLLIFSALAMAITAAVVSGRVTVYFRPTEYGLWWLVLSFPVMLLWHDFYFYVTHRLLHTRWLFRHVHGLHHRSRNPSPWAAYAFHPLEALVNALVTPLALTVVPLHVGVLLAFAVHQIARNAHGHAAVETMPRGFVTHWLGGRFTTTTHHHLHHETAQGNYGLWFTWWDRVFGTENPEYLRRFAEVTTRQPAETAPAGIAVT